MAEIQRRVAPDVFARLRASPGYATVSDAGAVATNALTATAGTLDTDGLGLVTWSSFSAFLLFRST